MRLTERRDKRAAAIDAIHSDATSVLQYNDENSLACVLTLAYYTSQKDYMSDETCGAVVDANDIDALTQAILNICTSSPFSTEACVNRASKYDKYERYKDYVKLYSEV